jgi:hypothetical protein
MWKRIEELIYLVDEASDVLGYGLSVGFSHRVSERRMAGTKFPDMPWPIPCAQKKEIKAQRIVN